MNGRLEVGMPGVVLGVTVLLAALSPLLLPGRLVVLDPLEGPMVSAPTAAVSAVAVTLAGCGVLLARRWVRLTRSRRPAALMVGQAHALAWAGVLLLAWPLASNGQSWATALLGLWGWLLGSITGWAATRHRPLDAPHAMLPPAHPGEGVAWTGHARLSADVTAPLLVVLLLAAGPSIPTLLHMPREVRLPILLLWLLLVLFYGGQLRALWVTVTIGGNGIRIRTGPFGRVMHRSWDQIAAVEVLDEELPSDTALWARRLARRYVLRPGPALRIGQPALMPAITVSVDHADQAASVAARHLTDHQR